MAKRISIKSAIYYQNSFFIPNKNLKNPLNIFGFITTTFIKSPSNDYFDLRSEILSKTNVTQSKNIIAP